MEKWANALSAGAPPQTPLGSLQRSIIPPICWRGGNSAVASPKKGGWWIMKVTIYIHGIPLPYIKKFQRIRDNLRRCLNILGGGVRTHPLPVVTPLGGKGWEGRGADSLSCPRAQMTLATLLGPDPISFASSGSLILTLDSTFHMNLPCSVLCWCNKHILYFTYFNEYFNYIKKSEHINIRLRFRFYATILTAVLKKVYT